MLEGLKNDLATLSQAIEQRLQPQWEDPREVCHFARGGVPWTCTYRVPLTTGTMGALMELWRNGKSRFSIVMYRPEKELAMWRQGLHAAVTETGVMDIGWWTRLCLQVRGRRIEFAREVEREQTSFGTVTDVSRYFVARVTGWRGQAGIVIVHTSRMSGSTKTRVSGSSIRMLPAECRIIADGLTKFTA